MRNATRTASVPFLALLAGALLAACAADGRVEVAMSSAPLTVAPGGPAARDWPHLVVSVTRVDVHVAATDAVPTPADGPVTRAAEDDGADDDGTWVTVFSGTHALDLYDTVATSAFLGAASVPAGRITQVRLVLAAEAMLIMGDATITVACPSCTQTGIKIVPHGTLEVPAGGTLALDLVFDQAASLESDGAGGFRLSPVIRL
jgi:hypothetical protein